MTKPIWSSVLLIKIDKTVPMEKSVIYDEGPSPQSVDFWVRSYNRKIKLQVRDFLFIWKVRLDPLFFPVSISHLYFFLGFFLVYFFPYQFPYLVLLCCSCFIPLFPPLDSLALESSLTSSSIAKKSFKSPIHVILMLGSIWGTKLHVKMEGHFKNR